MSKKKRPSQTNNGLRSNSPPLEPLQPVEGSGVGAVSIREKLREFSTKAQRNENTANDLQKLLGDPSSLRRITEDQVNRTILNSLYKQSIEAMAATLIAKDKELFEKIDPHEFFLGEKEPKPTLSAAAKYFNNVSYFIVKDILYLNEEGFNKDVFKIDEQRFRIEYWLNIADECLQNNNLRSINMAFAIRAALENVSVSRLNIAISGLSTQAKNLKEALAVLLSTEKNYKNVREIQTSSTVPIIPYAGMTSTDFTFFKSGNEARIEAIGEFAKWNDVQDIANRFAITQHNVEVMQTNKDLLLRSVSTALDELEFNEDTAYERSQEFKSRGAQQPDLNNSSEAITRFAKSYYQSKEASQPSASSDIFTPKNITKLQDTIVLLDDEGLKFAHSLKDITSVRFIYSGTKTSPPDGMTKVEINEEEKEKFLTEKHTFYTHPDHHFALYCLSHYGKPYLANDSLLTAEQIAYIQNKITPEAAAFNPETEFNKVKPLFENDFIAHQIAKQWQIPSINNIMLLPRFSELLFTNPPSVYIETVKKVHDFPPLLKAIAATYYASAHITEFAHQVDESQQDTYRKDNSIAVLENLIKKLHPLDLKKYFDVVQSPELKLSNPIREYIQNLVDSQKDIPIFDVYPDKISLAKELSRKMEDYNRIGKKTGGANLAGAEGGVFEFQFYSPDEGMPEGSPVKLQKHKILFKQDTSKEGKIHHDKNIAEFVTGRLMNKLIGDSAAVIILATRPGAEVKLPDKTGDNVYVGSVFVHQQYADFFKVMGYESRTPLFEEFHGRELIDTLCYKNMEGKYEAKYENFPAIAASSLLTANFDLHVGNFGTTPLPKNYQSTDAKPKDGFLVTLDFGAGMHNLENELHIHSRSRHRLGAGPLNHFLDFPREMKVNPYFANELERESKVDLREEIAATIIEIDKYYGVGPIIAYAKRTGMNVDNFEKKLSSLKDDDGEKLKADVLKRLKDFLEFKFEKRQQSQYKLAMEIKMSLCLVEKKTGLLNNNFEFKDVEYPVRNQEGKRAQASFSIDELIKQDPIYFLKNDFHFRNEEHAIELFGSNLLRVDIGQRKKLVKKINTKLSDLLGGIVADAVRKNDPCIFEYIYNNNALQAKLDSETQSELKQSYKTIIDNIATQLYHQSNSLTSSEEKTQNFSKNVVNLVKAEILSENQIEERTYALQRWVAIMAELYNKESFKPAIAIYKALVSEEVVLLKTNFAMLSNDAARVMQEMHNICGNNGNVYDETKISKLMEKETKSLPSSSYLESTSLKYADLAGKPKPFIINAFQKELLQREQINPVGRTREIKAQPILEPPRLRTSRATSQSKKQSPMTTNNNSKTNNKASTTLDKTSLQIELERKIKILDGIISRIESIQAKARDMQCFYLNDSAYKSHATLFSPASKEEQPLILKKLKKVTSPASKLT